MLIATKIPTTTIARCARLRAFLLNTFIVYSSYTTMPRRQTTRPKSRAIHSWYVLVPLAIIFGLFAKGAYTSFVKKRQADIEKDRYQERLDDLEATRTDLEAKIDKLETQRGREDEFRSRYNVVKEGETMIRIIDESPEDASQ